MRCISKFNQTDFFSHGVCFSLSYYIIKRFLAYQHTSGKTIERVAKQVKADQHDSSKLVEKGISTSFSIIRGMACGDNLRTRSLNYEGDPIGFPAALENIKVKVGSMPANRVGAFIGLVTKDPMGIVWMPGGHIIAALFKENRDEYAIFDPNYGLYALEQITDLNEDPISDLLGWFVDFAVLMTGAPANLDIDVG